MLLSLFRGYHQISHRFVLTIRIVVSATPPFLVVHTNAAYCRLSGIDSHAVVGKPISILLSIPDLQTLAEVTQNHQRQQETTEEAPGLESAIHRSLQNDDSNQDSNDNLFHTESRERYDLTAAEAAGRARAAASQADSVERIIATSGLGRWSIINLNAKPLLGQNLAIVKPSEIHKPRSREGDSNGSSIASNCEGSYRDIVCKFSFNSIVISRINGCKELTCPISLPRPRLYGCFPGCQLSRSFYCGCRQGSGESPPQIKEKKTSPERLPEPTPPASQKLPAS